MNRLSCLKPSVGAKDRAKYLAMQQRYSRNNSGSDDGSSGSRSNVAATVHHRKDVVNIVDEGAAKETAAIFEEQQTEMEDDAVEMGEAAVEEGGHEEVGGVVERDSGSEEELAPIKLLNEPMSGELFRLSHSFGLTQNLFNATYNEAFFLYLSPHFISYPYFTFLEVLLNDHFFFFRNSVQSNRYCEESGGKWFNPSSQRCRK